jgi:light-regulated signal transduction histidine kinase (bacteriophytochrome)
MPLKDEQGRVIQWFGTNTDVTDQKRAEEALELRVEQRTAELVAANKELEAFGYSVSHDLRAPLRHVSSYISLLEKGTGPSLDDKSRRQVQIIAEAAKRMGGLIDDLLVLSRIGRASLAETNVDLRRLVDDARKELAPEMAGRTIEWRIGALPQVRADAALLRSAVVNLLSNAIKYSRRRDPARIELGSREHDGEVVLFVKDNGAGFDMRFADKLFGVFQRLHDRDEFEGTGIGLASVRRIIQRHGGRTWAEGAVEQGASFYFSLPIERVIQMKGAECGVRNQETSPGNQTKLEEVT